MPPSRLAALALAALLGLALAPGAAPAATCPARHWVASWLASPSDAATGGFHDQTLRTIVTPHLGGSELRLHLSNRFGAEPVTFDAVVIARRLDGAAVVPGTGTPVTFGGARSVTVPAGGEAVSDPAGLRFGAFDDLAVSIAFSGDTGPATEHFYGRRTVYATDIGSGDHSGDESGDAYARLASTAQFFVSGLDVVAPGDVGAVVAFGDSITDGYEGSPSPLAPNREGLDVAGAYPDDLQRRLLATPGGPPVAVLDAGITGNRLLHDGLIPQHGPRAIDRLQPDALDAAGVAQLLVLEGINDLGTRSTGAPGVINGLTALIRQAHAAGLSVLLGTLTPSEGAQPPTYGDEAAEAARQEVNAWIRGQHSAGVVDFDAALRDPADPARLQDRYDSGDHLHPNLAGYQAMADAVDLALLRGADCEPCRRRSAEVRVPRRYRAGMRDATVRADGRVAGRIRRARDAVRIHLTRRRGSTVHVRMRVRMRDGRTVTVTRRLRACSR